MGNEAILGCPSSIDQATDQPPAQPEMVCPVDTLAGDWWVVHTKSRNEKALASDLQNLGIGCFLPLVQVRRQYGRRTIRLDIALFPGYLFMCGGDDERYATLSTHRAANIIRVVDQEGLRKQLQHIHRITTSGQPVNLYPGLKRGCRCRVIRGCLKGLEGVVIKRRGACRVYVAVDVLGQSAELEIDASLLEVIW